MNLPISSVARAVAASFLIVGYCVQILAAPASTSEKKLVRRGLPVVFEPNRGQAHPGSRYVAHIAGGEALLLPDGLELVQLQSNQKHTFHLSFAGGSTSELLEESATGGVANYYHGTDRSQWITGVPLYQKVRYRNIYPGTDLIFHGSASQLEYDFALLPNADPARIRIDFSDADRLEIGKDGSLLVAEGGHKLRFLAPAASQEVAANSRAIPVTYQLLGPHEAGFAVGPYDHSAELIIDPVVSYTGSLNAGGGGTSVAAIAVDASGDLIMTGSTYSSTYPVVNGLPSVTNPSEQVVVTMLDPTGKTILYSTYLPASNFSTASAIAVDSSGNAYVSGIAGGADFPVTSSNLGTCNSFCNAGFVTKLNPSGSIVYSTLLGSGQILPIAITVDSVGSAFVTGIADTSLQTVNAFQITPGGAFFAKLNTTGTAYLFASYLGSDNLGQGIALDSKGNLYVAGSFSVAYGSSVPLKGYLESGVGGFFLTKFASDGKTLLFGSFLGGDISGSSAPENLSGIAIGADNTVYLAGTTASYGFPYTIGAYRHPLGIGLDGTTQMFAMALDPTLTTLKYSTFLGDGYMNAMAVDSAGNLYAAGATNADAIRAKDAVVADLTSGGEFLELDPTGNPVQVSGFGGQVMQQPPSALTIDASGNIYLAGNPRGAAGFYSGNAGADAITVGAAAYLAQAGSEGINGSAFDLFFAKIAPAAKPQISLGYLMPFLPLHNVGSADLHISNIAVSGGITKVQGSCGATVPAGTSCVLTLTDANGNLAQGTVTITSDASPSVQTFTPYANPEAIGTPVQDFLWVDTSQLFFPPQQTGTMSAPRSFRIWNAGATSLNLQSIAASGSLQQTHDCTTSLAPAAYCTVQVIWAPGTGNSDGESVSIGYDSQAPLTYNVPSEFLTSPSPLLVSLQNPLSFGTQAVGNPSLYRTVTVTNVSGAPVPAPTVSLSGDSAFSLAGNTCTAKLAPQQSCTVAPIYAPIANGDSSATLQIGKESPASIQLTGTGLIQSAITVSPYELAWYNVVLGASYSQSVMLTNSSNGSIPVSSITFTLSDYSETDTCGGALAGGASCTVNVNFSPQAVGTRNAMMTVSFGGSATAQVLPLTGQGLYPVSLSPASLNFGANNQVGVASAAQSVIISNNSNEAQSYTLAVSGPFTINNSCPNPMPGQYGCGVPVTFTPSVTGMQTGSLTISVPEIATTSSSSLTGGAVENGVVPGLQFVPVTPCRVADTRNPQGPFGGPEVPAGAIREFVIPQSSCDIPASAVAYSLNVTAVPDAALNYLTLWPSGQPQPTVSTLNSDGRVKANAAITPAGTNGSVSVFVSDASQVILDISGYFIPVGNPSSMAFYPLTPCRVVDTRSQNGDLGGPFIPGKTARSFPILASNCQIPVYAAAYSLNVTAVPHTTLNYLTAWTEGQHQPNVSTLNSSTGEVTANSAIVPASSSNGGGVSIFVSDDADVILDINGYFARGTGGLSLYTVSPCRVIDTRGTSGPFNGELAVGIENSPCALPSAAQAYVFNATAVPVGALEYLTLWPEGGPQPNVSTLNANDAAVTSNMAIVPATSGSIDAFADGATNLILDISSYFAP